MFRRVHIFALCTVAALAFTSVISAAAMAASSDPESGCAGKPAGLNGTPKFYTDPDGKKVPLTDKNGTQLGGPNIFLNDSTAGAPSALQGSVLLCGSNFDDIAKPVGFTAGTIKLPYAYNPDANKYVNTLITRCANPVKNPNCKNADGSGNLKAGQYMGSTTISAYLNAPSFSLGLAVPDVKTNVFVNEAPQTNNNFKKVAQANCTPDAIACYQALDVLGTAVGDMTVTEVNGRAQLNIFPPIARFKGTDPATDKVFLTKIGPVSLCTFAGSVVAEEPLSNAVINCGTDATQYTNTNVNHEAKLSCNVINWMIQNSTAYKGQKVWNGVGARVSATSNVPGATATWADDIAKWQAANPGGDWTTNKDLVDAVVKKDAGGNIIGGNLLQPLDCTEMTLTAAPAGKPGAQKPGNDNSSGKSSTEPSRKKAANKRKHKSSKKHKARKKAKH